MKNVKELNLNVDSILEAMVKNGAIDKVNGDYSYTVYSDYRDEIGLDRLQDDNGKLKDRDDVVMDFYYDIEINDDYTYSEIVGLIKDAIQELNQTIEDVDELDIDSIMEISDTIDSVREWIFIDYEIDRIMGNTKCKVNVLLNTNEEWNTDYSNNKLLLDYILSDDIRELIKEELKEIKDNSSLNLLFQSQGYEIEDLQDDSKVNSSKFLKSVLQEWENLPYSMSQLAIMLESNAYEVFKDFKQGNEITIDTNIELGLFNCWNGSGSVLEIELEKPFTFTIDNHTTIQIEGSGNNSDYSIDEVYGLVGSCWKSNFKVENPSL